MYLFSRRAQLSGVKLREAMGWAVAAGERVTQTTGLQVGLWAQVHSPGVGTLVWATFVPDLATLEGATDKLAVDDAYNALGDRAVEFVIPGSVDDSLSVVVHGEPDPNRQVEYVAAVRTTIVAGKIGKGMAAEMALNTDESFIDLIDKKAGGVYSDMPGASTQLIYRRVSG